MSRITVLFLTAFILVLLASIDEAWADTFGSGVNTFDIEFAYVGNPGNPSIMNGNRYPAGSVPYGYRIGKYEISRDIVTKTNTVGNLAITLHPMDSVAGGPRPDMPATGITWNEAARFVNWLNTSQGFHAAYKFSKQPGDVGYVANTNIILWQPGDLGFDAANRFRNRRARYFLPSSDEWFKAAYYDPDANGGAGGYWNYPTGSDLTPIAVANGTAFGTAVWDQSVAQGPADITLAGGLSPYGVMALAGNAWEWEETQYFLTNDDGSEIRGIRGGAWNTEGAINFAASLLTSHRGLGNPIGGGSVIGFRVASTPEPSALLLGLMAGLATMLCKRMR